MSAKSAAARAKSTTSNSGKLRFERNAYQSAKEHEDGCGKQCNLNGGAGRNGHRSFHVIVVGRGDSRKVLGGIAHDGQDNEADKKRT